MTQLKYAQLQMHYRNILTRGASELPPVPERKKGQKGRIAKTDAQNLWARLSEHEASVLLFAKQADVPFTNNQAELHRTIPLPSKQSKKHWLFERLMTISARGTLRQAIKHEMIYRMGDKQGTLSQTDLKKIKKNCPKDF